MSVIRRGLQVVALLCTLVVGGAAAAVIVSQTAWFRGWLRGFIVRQADDYVNGQLSIGGLGGNLFFGVELEDVAVHMKQQPVITVEDISLDYSVFQLISGGITLDDIRLSRPIVHLRHTDTGWNLARLIRKQEQEADREGPKRPLSIGSIGVTDGSLIVEGAPVGTSGVNVPERVDRLNAKLAFSYEPVRYALDIGHLSFRTVSPDVGLSSLSGTISVKDDSLILDRVAIRTEESSVLIDGRVLHYLTTPALALSVSSDKVALGELARLVPALAGIGLQPAFELSAKGPADRLVLNLNARSSAGDVVASLVADATAPRRAVSGEVRVANLDLAALTRNPAQKSDITGRARLDLRVDEVPGASPLTGVSGRYAVDARHVAIAGYQARQIAASGRVDRGSIRVDGSAHAYGGYATVKGTITPPSGAKDVLALDLRGTASSVDLRGLPRSLRAPAVASDLTAAYHVTASGPRVSGDLRLHASTLAGAKLADGTMAEFSLGGGRVEYAASGLVANLDLQTIGRGFDVAALDSDRYRSAINTTFNVRGTGTDLARLTLDATGEVTDSDILGGRVPRLAFESHLAGGGARVKAQGSFAGFDPALISGKEELKGEIGGSLDVTATVRDFAAGVTPGSIDAGGTVMLADSTVGGLAIKSASADATYADRVGRIRDLTLTGPDANVKASGVISLDDHTASNLAYHVDTSRLARIGELIGQPLTGALEADGTVSGNRSELRTSGTLVGSDLGYGPNEALTITSQYNVALPALDVEQARIGAKTMVSFLQVGGQRVTGLTATTSYTLKRLEFEASAQEGVRNVDASGALVLHPDHQEVHLRQLTLRTEGVEWKTEPGIEAAIQYGNSAVGVENLRLVSGDQGITADGTLGTATGELKIEAKNVNLSQIDALVLGDQRLAGRLNAGVVVTGPMVSPQLAGRFSISGGAFRAFTFDSLQGRVDYDKRGITLDARLQQTPQAWLTASGFLPAALFSARGRSAAPGVGHENPAPGEGIDLRIQSSPIDLGLVQGFTSAVTAVTGTVQTDVRVTGSAHDPHLAGFVEVSNGAFSVPDAKTTYTGLDTRIDLAPDGATIDRLRVVDEHNHTLTISGQLATHERQIGAVNIAVKSDTFEIIDNELADIKLNSDFRIGGELRRPRIDGDIGIAVGQVNVDTLLDLTTSNRYGTEATTYGPVPATEASEPAAPSIFDALTMDVRVQVPNDLVLKGSELKPAGSAIGLGAINLTVGGDIRARKSPGDSVRLVGIVNTVRGTYDFQGRRFDILRDGRIRFDGLPELNPALDLAARRLISGVEATVHVRGNLRSPELTLTSVPALDEADILSLIVFNQPANSLGEGQQVSLAARAGALATGFVASSLAESIGSALELDVFEIQTAPENGGAATLTVGEQVGERLFVKFRQGFGAQSTSEFILEYQLADFLRLQSSIAENGGAAVRTLTHRVERGGLDLIFFFSY